MDLITGQIVNPGSPLAFLVIFGGLGLGLFVYSKLNHKGYEKLEDAFKAQLAEVKARAGASFPKVVADLEADFAALKAKIETLTK